ncbi:MAG: hypothetical protein MZV70_51030, partial [Desulfobacterales bacterium]|nr:hypothetical protein [Desulfobacterales bacterium]
PLTSGAIFRYKRIKLIGVIMFLKDLDSGRIQILSHCKIARRSSRTYGVCRPVSLRKKRYQAAGPEKPAALFYSGTKPLFPKETGGFFSFKGC